MHMPPDKRTLFESGPYPYYFRLFDGIEKVEEGGYIVHVRFLGMNPDGTVKDMPDTETEKLGYYMDQIFSLQELEIEEGQDWNDKCDQWNRLEADEAIHDLRDARTELASLPRSEPSSVYVTYIDNIIGVYSRWIREHGFQRLILEGLPAVATESIPKALRGPKELGNYYVKAVEHFHKVRPTLSELSEVSTIPKSTWNDYLNHPHILLAIWHRVGTKMHMARPKEKKEYWGEVLIDIEDLTQQRASRKTNAKERSVGRDIDNYRDEEVQI